MAAEFLTEDLLRTSLMRLSRVVAKTHPEFGEVLAQNVVRTCGLLPDLERANHYGDLGTLLIDLGRLYLAEADMLRTVSEASGSTCSDVETDTSVPESSLDLPHIL